MNMSSTVTNTERGSLVQLLHLHNGPLRRAVSSLFYRTVSSGSERLSHWPDITQLVNAKVTFKPRSVQHEG